MEMFNNHLLCEDLSTNKNETSSGFETKNEARFKTLKVICSKEADVLEDDLIQVPINAGQPDPSGENRIIINRGDIIYKL